MKQFVRCLLSILPLVALVLLAQATPAKQAETPPTEPPAEQPAAPPETPDATAPHVPTPEEIEAAKATLPYTPLDFNFRVGIVGEVKKEIVLETGTQTQVSSPLVLVDPRDAGMRYYAQNFPARIVANSQNGEWVIGIVPSAAVEGSSGSRNKECAVSLHLPDADTAEASRAIKLICEFPLHSNFQALFTLNDANVIYYCVNEPGAENKILRYDLRAETSTALPAEGNRFMLYGLKRAAPAGLWISGPLSTPENAEVNLVELAKGDVLKSLNFPGVREVIARPNGETLLATVERSAEASLGYYDLADSQFHQIKGLVLTKPTVKWLRNSAAVIAKESTTTRDRFLRIDVATGEAHEIFSGYFKIAQWDISPNDEALVFIVATPQEPQVFIVPLDPSINVVNRIVLKGISNVTWLGCLQPPREGGSWLERLLPW